MHNKKTILTAALLGMALLLSACSKMTQGDGVGGSLSDSSPQSQTMTQGDGVGGHYQAAKAPAPTVHLSSLTERYFTTGE